MSESALKTASQMAKESLVAQHGEEHRCRIEEGVSKCLLLWQDSDGSADQFHSFCLHNFWGSELLQQKAFHRLERNFEILFGHLGSVQRHLAAPQDLTSYDPSPVDDAFAEFSPMAHLTDDLFANKIAFQIALNFPSSTLKDRDTSSSNWSRQRWAQERLADTFLARVPALVAQNGFAARSRADSYIANYNVCVHNLRSDKGEPLFTEERNLITHWGLRDEIRAQYSELNPLAKQEALYKVMGHIISQSIPREAINGVGTLWNLGNNTISTDGGVQWTSGTPEGGERYAHLQQVFDSETQHDPYFPEAPSRMARVFLHNREIPEPHARGLFETLLSSPLLAQTGRWVSHKLGRPLRPFDIWFTKWDESSQRQSDLDSLVRSRYPHAGAFQEDLPRILLALGFSEEKAKWLADRIEVDPARGSGHAAPCLHKTDKAHLRTRIGSDGMDYKGFNIAIHELGHNVEQVFSLYGVDHYLLSGVPNTAFTEAFAFAFQGRDKTVLGFPSERDDNIEALREYWQTCEIAAVAQVDMDLWHWMYANPKASPQEIGCAVERIARTIWNRFWAPVVGVSDSSILAIYSHMISANLYLPDYPLGHIISYQVERHLRTHSLPTEMERMCRLGRLTPNVWMREAVGEEISVEPLLADVTKALKCLA